LLAREARITSHPRRPRQSSGRPRTRRIGIWTHGGGVAIA